MGGCNVWADAEEVAQGHGGSPRRRFQAEMPIALQRDEKGHVGCHCHRHSFGERRAKRCLSKRLGPLGPHAGGPRDGDAQGRAELVAGPPRLIPATDPAMQATPPSLFLLFPFNLQNAFQGLDLLPFLPFCSAFSLGSGFSFINAGQLQISRLIWGNI